MRSVKRWVSQAGFCASGMCCAVAAWGQYLEFTEAHFAAVEKRYGADARVRVEDWQALMRNINASGELEDKPKVHQANDFFNRVRWVSDLEHWGQNDYWATPIETLGTNAGDCEDFSIGKYFTLNEVGVDTAKVRITYVKALEYNQAHMVLAYYPSPEAEPWILDNINKTILPASKRADLLPIYSFNGDGLWLAKARGKKLNGDSKQSLPQWGDVNTRMLSELLD